MSPSRWLGFAAAPTFTAMAVVTGLQEAQAGAMVCGPTPAGGPLSGMVAMYLLMSVFHLGPWLRLLAEGRGTRQPP